LVIVKFLLAVRPTRSTFVPDRPISRCPELLDGSRGNPYHRLNKEPPMIVLAVGCHPDDIEFMMSGTLFLLGEAGCSLHYLTIANGDMGSMTLPRRRIAAVRRRESMCAAAYLGAAYHASLTGDIEVFYSSRLIRRVAAVIRRVRPDIMLVQSLEDYMEDHMTSARLAVTAAFVRGMPNYRTIPPVASIDSDVMVLRTPSATRCGGRSSPSSTSTSPRSWTGKSGCSRCTRARNRGSTGRRGSTPTSP
jgi:LmbE family N-acetylglucosaminyl deacetylase